MKNTRIFFSLLLYCAYLDPFSLCLSESAAEETQHEEHEEHSAHEHHDDGEHEEHEEDTMLKLSDAQIREFDIGLETAGPGALEQFVETPGAVVVNEEAVSHISARFPGIVKKVQKRVGDFVEKDEILAVVESSESLSPYPIKSLLAGTVIARHATLGELLQEDDIAFTVANLETVWVNLSIYQADIPLIRKGQKAIVSQGHGQTEAEGIISYLSPVIDEDSRTATARVVLANSSGSWMPGLFVTAKIKTAETAASLLIPRTALNQINNETVVFVRYADGFRPSPVTLGDGNESHVIVLSGLRAGQEFVSKNGFALKAELAKSSFGHGHHH